MITSESNVKQGKHLLRHSDVSKRPFLQLDLFVSKWKNSIFSPFPWLGTYHTPPCNFKQQCIFFVAMMWRLLLEYLIDLFADMKTWTIAWNGWNGILKRWDLSHLWGFSTFFKCWLAPATKDELMSLAYIIYIFMFLPIWVWCHSSIYHAITG